MKYYAFIQGYDFVKIIERKSLRSVLSNVRRIARQKKPDLRVAFARGNYPEDSELESIGLASTGIINLNGTKTVLMVTQFWNSKHKTYFGEYRERWVLNEEI